MCICMRVIYGQNLTLFEMYKSLSVTVQNGIPQAFYTDRIPCQTHQMVHDDIDFTTHVSSEICTNKSADFRRNLRERETKKEKERLRHGQRER